MSACLVSEPLRKAFPGTRSANRNAQLLDALAQEARSSSWHLNCRRRNRGHDCAHASTYLGKRFLALELIAQRA
jgi:hypothetical protein